MFFVLFAFSRGSTNSSSNASNRDSIGKLSDFHYRSPFYHSLKRHQSPGGADQECHQISIEIATQAEGPKGKSLTAQGDKGGRKAYCRDLGRCCLKTSPNTPTPPDSLTRSTKIMGGANAGIESERKVKAQVLVEKLEVESSLLTPLESSVGDKEDSCTMASFEEKVKCEQLNSGVEVHLSIKWGKNEYVMGIEYKFQLMVRLSIGYLY